MTIATNQIYPLIYTRTAGICYLIIIIAGAAGQLFLRDSFSVPTDVIAENRSILVSPALWRAGMFCDILMQILDVPVMVILYVLLKPVDKNVALLGLAFNLIQTAVLVVNKLSLLLPLIILRDVAYQEAFEQRQIYAQVRLLTEIHNYGFFLGLIFFGFTCIAYGNLVFRSGYFPKLIGVFVFAAGVSYLIYSIGLIIAPEISTYLNPILAICLIGELSFSLWLILKGVDINEWRAACNHSGSNI